MDANPKPSVVRDKAAITVGSSQGSRARNSTYNRIDTPDEQLSNDDDAGRTLVINKSKFEDRFNIFESWMGNNPEAAIDISEGLGSRYTIEDEFSLFLPLPFYGPQDPYSSLGLLEEQVTEELATASQARSILDSLDATFSSVDMIEPHIRKGRRDRFPSYAGGEKKYTGADSEDENIYPRSIKKCSARQEKSAKCPYPECDYASATRNDLQSHIDCLHSIDPNEKHRCPVCYESRLISLIDNFKTHLKKTHKLSEGEILEYVKQSKERVAAYREKISPNRPGATTSIRSSTESREPQLLKKYEPEKAHFERLEREDRDAGIKADNPPTTQPTTNYNYAGYDQRYDLSNDNDLSDVLPPLWHPRDDRDAGIKADNPPTTTQPTTNYNYAGYDQRYDLSNDNDLSDVLPPLGHPREGARASGRSRYTERRRRERAALSRRETNTTKGTGKRRMPVP